MYSISIIIPTYKPQDYIFECFDSIRNQTFLHENIEVIVVLNGEQEPYQQKINDYFQSVDFNVNFIYTQKKGVSNARNIGIENAKGEYILFLDDDDLISPNYLTELFINRIDNGITVSNVKTFTTDIYQLNDDYLSKAYYSNLNNRTTSIFKLRSFLSTSCCKLIHKEIIANKRFNPKITIGEDSVFMFLLSNQIREIKVCSNPEAIYYRRIRNLSASRTKNNIKTRISYAFRLMVDYTIIFAKSPLTYNFKLYLSRVFAAISKLFKSI